MSERKAVSTKTIERWRCVTIGKGAVIATMQVWRNADGYFVEITPAGVPAGYDAQAVPLKSKTTALSVARDRRREYRSSPLVRWEKIYP